MREGRKHSVSMTGQELTEAARKVRLLILDVDGVLTDGSIILDNEGNEFKAFHVRDGHGIKMLGSAGITIAIITGRYSQVVERRAAELGIAEVYQRCYVKTDAFEKILEKHGLRNEEVAYVGDDVVDIPVLRRVGLAVAVGDADEETKAHAMYITRQGGGRGAVREVCELLLRARGLWESVLKGYRET